MNDNIPTVVTLGNPTAIPKHHQQWFEKLLEAAERGHLLAFASSDPKTGQYLTGIGILAEDDDSTVQIVPLGNLATTDNPYDAYTPPILDPKTLN